MKLSACALVRAFHALLLAWACKQAAGNDFLGHAGAGRRNIDVEFRTAMASVMGCRAESGLSPDEHVDSIKIALAPMWTTLPKNRGGKIEWKMLRYAAHRYFMQQSSLLVRGFEPQRHVNSSSLGSAEILSKRGAAVTDAILVGKVNGHGFSLDDVAFMIAALERMIFDSETARLARAYQEHRRSVTDALNHAPLASIIETYMMLWMLGDDEQTIKIVLKNRKLINKVFPLWPEVRDYADGVVKKMEFKGSRSPTVGQGHGAMERTYSFSDAHDAVGYITRNFASFWETECQSIKNSLMAMDSQGTGRIALSEFYGANMDGEWRFGESEAYLRELGALDETSRRGSQVIIPNYLQGASNCIVTTDHYMVCCVNECEGMLNEIETAMSAPVANPSALLDFVRNMTNFDDEPPKVDGTLAIQLERIAEMHGGQVPLHGRLFAQWLHYVFPQECPYPHKAGAASAASVLDFGSQSYASDEEVRGHAALRNLTSAQVNEVEEAQWMSQWTEEEELRADYDLGRAPWERTGSFFGYGCGAAAMLSVAWTMATGAAKGLKAPGSSDGDHKPLFV